MRSMTSNLWALPYLAALVAVGLILVLASSARRRRSSARQLAPFAPRALLNKSEARLAAVLDSYAVARGLRLRAQVSYGEFLTTRDRGSFLRVNSKRADFVLVDAAFQVRAVIELHGSGHYGRSPAERVRADMADDVKARAVRSAGIPYIVVPQRYDKSEVYAALDAGLGSVRDPTYARTHP